jgi:putative ABC transport system substrate-binding protein
MKKNAVYFLLSVFLFSCKNAKNKTTIPVIGFADAFQDETIARAKAGFFDALKQQDFSEEKGNIKIIYRNAQGDIPALTQIIDYFVSEKVTLIASNATLPTITAVQKTKDIPIFMMVAPDPKLAHLEDKNNHVPANLFGVYENLQYIDTSVKVMKEVMPAIKTIGTVFNQSEPQSQAALDEINNEAKELGLQVIALPVNNSAETQLVLKSLLSKNIDAFFAPPDNTIFASFETIVKSCNEKNIPIFTSEAGLVKRGAVAAYGADMYQWGFQSGIQAAQFLKQGGTKGLQPEIVKVRNRIYNSVVANHFHFSFNSNFSAIQ